MKLHALEEGGPSVQLAPSLSLGAIRGRRQPIDQGKAKHHHTCTAATAGVQASVGPSYLSLGKSWLYEPCVALGSWTANI